MGRRKKEDYNEDNDSYNNIDSSENENFLNQDEEDGEIDINEDAFDDYYEDELEQAKEDKKNKKKEFYVKGSELIEEIRKYQESKKDDPERKRNYFRRTWFNDFKDLYKIFDASKIQWLFIS